jgi:hypothetical protein
MILPDALKIKMEFYYTCLNFSLIFHVKNV